MLCTIAQSCRFVQAFRSSESHAEVASSIGLNGFSRGPRQEEWSQNEIPAVRSSHFQTKSKGGVPAFAGPLVPLSEEELRRESKPVTGSMHRMTPGLRRIIANDPLVVLDGPLFGRHLLTLT